MRVAVFPGSFDPVTRGHEDLIKRAMPLFDGIIIALGNNADKKYMYNLEQRKKFLEDTFGGIKGISIEAYNGLTIDFCRKHKADYILRGIRNTADFEFEKSIAHSNRTMSGIETVVLFTDVSLSHISSTIVRDIIRNQGDASSFVPAAIRL